MILIVLCIIFGIVKTECPTGVFKFVNISNQLEYPELRRTTTDSVRSCGAECVGTPGCRSFGYQEVTWECYLYDIRVWYGLGNKLDGKPSSSSSSPFIHYWKAEDVCTKWYASNFNLCYELYKYENMSWNGARQFCESKGGVLFMPDTSEKQNFLDAILRSEGISNKVCVGTTDENNPNTWNWFNGIQVTNIQIGQNEHCGMIQQHKDLVSALCTAECHPLCEFPTSPILGLG